MYFITSGRLELKYLITSGRLKLKYLITSRQLQIRYMMRAGSAAGTDADNRGGGLIRVTTIRDVRPMEARVDTLGARRVPWAKEPS